ncbi:MAG: Obg family GTPase CgtA [Candidatus Woesebacteria bacterium]|nr:MAG: Obg family GTPase CgtA [Candidatus Woesebacteria bacterium]
MLIDRAEITIRGGHGGHGMPNKFKGPDGGNGGDGGSVFVKTSSNLNLLNQFSEKDVFIAENGSMGGKNNRSGKQGKDIEILLPAGTSVIEKDTGEVILELTKPDERILICRGGRGGFGGTTGTPGTRGEEKKVILSLKLIADFGLIGLPNAGKSSLLNELTNAKAETANYPFTTLEPNLGVLEGKCIADIPGLIEGASGGKGLGIGFLKHIEKVSMLLHCISCESPDVIRDYKTVRGELEKFGFDLTKKPEIIILTKTDLVSSEDVQKLVKKLSKIVKKVLAVSIHDYSSLEDLKLVLRNF